MAIKQVPSVLQFIFGEEINGRSQLLIGTSALIASSILLALSKLTYHHSICQQVVIVVLAWDLVGGGVAHLLPANRLFWRSLQPEWLVVWTASYAWHPLLFISAFGGGLSVLAGLHLLCIMLVAGQYWIGNRGLFYWAVLAFVLGIGAGYWLAIPGGLLWFPALYLLKSSLFDKAPPRSRYHHRSHKQVVVSAQLTIE
ncbi:hypothetical protein [Fibrella aquatilis]|uniref:Uncharacterized protein n=1 Tax=Fibrella aquatilis TaxID=2817059 RepID=A0A939JWH2_9BACT|nr:hypothetical protein [Fibrella aquatilis]MBO0931912.1 hypothetical protein [Fibrella aquatilis]